MRTRKKRLALLAATVGALPAEPVAAAADT